MSSSPFDLPKICDAVFATCVADDRGQAATLYWARTRFFGAPLLLLDWDVAQLEPKLWTNDQTTLVGFGRACRARYGSMGIYVEDESLAAQAEELGVRCETIYEHLVATDKWTSLCLSTTLAMKGGKVKIAKPADERTKSRAAGFLSFSGGPRGEDPTVAAFVYGVVLALDPVA